MDESDREEAMREALFPQLTIEQFRALAERQRRAFQALPAEEQQRIRASADRAWSRNQEVAAWDESLAAIQRASRRDP